MNIKNIRWFRVTALTVVSAVALTSAMAQGPGGGRPPAGGGPQQGGPPQGGPGGGGPGGGGIAQSLAGLMGYALDITEAQRTQIRSIVEQSVQANQSVLNQLRTLHEQEVAAVKANKSEQELRALAQQASTVMAQANGARLVAEAKVYQVLTPAQRDKLERITSALRERARAFRPPAE